MNRWICLDLYEYERQVAFQTWQKALDNMHKEYIRLNIFPSKAGSGKDIMYMKFRYYDYDQRRYRHVSSRSFLFRSSELLAENNHDRILTWDILHVGEFVIRNHSGRIPVRKNPRIRLPQKYWYTNGSMPRANGTHGWR